MKKIKYTGIDEEMYFHKFSNGLEVYMHPNNKVANFYITYNVKFGSRVNEYVVDKEKKSRKIPLGIAHFLEHLTFKMEDGLEATEYFSQFGSGVNAYTTYDFTCYEVLGNNSFKENLEYLFHFVNTPCYNKEIVENEKGIIAEEVKMYDDNPDRFIFDTVMNNIYVKDNIRNKIAGTVKDVKSTTLENIKDAYEYFYNYNNSFIVISGNFNKEEAIAIIEEEIGKHPKEKHIVNIKYPKEPLKVVNNNISLKLDNELPNACFAFKMNLSKFKNLELDKFSISLLLKFICSINFGRTSELAEVLNEGNILLGRLDIETIELENNVVLIFTGKTYYPKRFLSLLKEKLKNLEINEEDFERKKKVFISEFVHHFDDIESVNTYMIESNINFGKVVNDYINIIKKFDINTYKKACELIDINTSLSLTTEKKVS